MRTLAIGDIHGCSIALRALLDAVQPGPEDLVVTMGDYLDRGPDSAGVMEILLKLEGATQLKPLLGNHEILFLDAHAKCLDETAWLQVGGRETLLSYSGDGTLNWDKVPQPHVDFLARRCLRFFETPTHIFVHANLNACLPLNEQSDDWLFWTRFEHVYPHVSGKMIVCGHTPQKTGVPARQNGAICIDTWAYGQGWLTCFDVDANTFTQANQAGRVRKLTFDDVQPQCSQNAGKPLVTSDECANAPAARS